MQNSKSSTSRAQKTDKSRKSDKSDQRGRRQQPRKDSSTKRVNFDNERVAKFDTQVRRGECNDVSWYARNPELLKAAASIPWTGVTGATIDGLTTKYAIPGICSIHWVPFFGGEPIQQSMNSHYSFTVHANSRNYKYDAPDQYMMIMAGAQVFAAIAHAIRAYGTLRRYNGLNMYTPDALVTMMGFNASNLKTSLSKMWFDINQLVSRSAQIWIPNDMPVIERWFWMNSNIYVDSTSAKGQYYMFVPRVFFKLSETASETGTSLVDAGWNPGTSQGVTWDQYLNIVNDMMTALENSQDRGIIFGDILNAYGQDKIYGISPISSDYAVEPKFNAEVQSQIENLTTCAIIPTGLQQDTGRLFPTFSTITDADLTNMEALSHAILNFHFKEQPTPEQIMVATRLTTLGLKTYRAAPEGGSAQYGPAYAGTEYVTTLRIVTNNWTSGQPTLSQLVIASNSLNKTGWLTVGNAFAYSAFDWAPFVYEGLNVSLPSPGTVGSIGSRDVGRFMGDPDNYTTIDMETLNKMHTTAQFSELGVPANL